MTVDEIQAEIDKSNEALAYHTERVSHLTQLLELEKKAGPAYEVEAIHGMPRARAIEMYVKLQAMSRVMRFKASDVSNWLLSRGMTVSVKNKASDRAAMPMMRGGIIGIAKRGTGQRSTIYTIMRLQEILLNGKPGLFNATEDKVCYLSRFSKLVKHDGNILYIEDRQTGHLEKLKWFKPKDTDHVRML